MPCAHVVCARGKKEAAHFENAGFIHSASSKIVVQGVSDGSVAASLASAAAIIRLRRLMLLRRDGREEDSVSEV